MTTVGAATNQGKRRGLGARPAWVAAATSALALVVAPTAASAQETPPPPPTAAPAAPLPRRLDEDLVTPRMMALGGRAEAISSSTSSIFSNPASVVATRVYHVDAYTSWDPTIGTFTFGSGMVDSTRSFLSAGMAYRYTTLDTREERRTGHDVRLALAVPIGTFLGIGASARYLNITAGPQLPSQSNTSLHSRDWAGFTFDAGVFVRPVQWIHLSASGRNLNNPDSSAAPIGVGFGAAVLPAPIITVVGDVLLDFRMTNGARGRYSGGVELFFADHFAVRGGYMFDDTRGALHAITAGLGYLSQMFGAELSLRQGIVPETQTTLMLSLRYFHQVATQ